MNSFLDKVAIVTGAGSGIGRAAAWRLAMEGARVCVADIDEKTAARTVTLITEAGGQAFACRTDVSSPSDNERMVAQAVEHFGDLDIALLNAGYLGPMDGFEATDEALFDRHLAINLKGAFLGLKSVHAQIRKGGAVVVTASTAALVGLSESPGYTAAKHGVVGLVRASAEAFAAKGARINALCPGRVDTPMMGVADDTPLAAPADLERVRFRGRATPQHVAEFALYLASPAAGFLTGGAYVCDGGLLSSFGPVSPGP